ncbi:MAG: peptidyl-prolyl cis-trans isomerase [Candidatus Methylacidiphilales bacterium]|nr:peptidyl-prolyl cis-trans isomerase [Candidatus Methylacidiphilales bacterium]
MLTFLSQKLKFILVFVLVIIAVSFVFFGNWSGNGRRGGATFAAKIKGRPVNLTEYQNAIRASRIAYTLSTGRIPGSGDEAGREISQQAWLRLLLLEEIHQAGLAIKPEEVQLNIRNSPLFQDPEKKTFSPENFKKFQDFVLNPQGVGLERFFEIMREQVLIETWMQSLQDTVVVPPSEADAAFKNYFAPVNMEYLQLSPESLAGKIETNDGILRAFYEKHSDRFALPEQRKVEYVLFKLPPAPKDQSADETAKTRRALGEKAYQFTEPFYNAMESNAPLPDFAAQAKGAGLEVQTSPYFAKEGFVIPGPSGTSLAQLAFTLTPAKPVSDYVQINEGFAVLRLKEVQPPTLRPFDSVKDDVRKAFLENETNLRAQAAIESLTAKLKQELAAGKTFAQAAAAAGQSPAKLPAFVVASPDPKSAQTALLNAARYRSIQLQPGQISDPTPLEGKVVIFHLASRGEPDAAKRAEALPRVTAELAQENSRRARDLYFASLIEAKGTQFPGNLFGGN